MIFISIKDLLPLVPDLIDLFLSGLLFLLVYGWLNTKKYDISLLVIWSLFISYIIKIFYDVVPLNLKGANMSIVYIATGVLLAIILTSLKQTRLIRKIVPHLNNKSVNDDIFDDIIDYQKRTIMAVYLKNSDIYYCGRFAFREEKGNSSWICLFEYSVIDKKTNDFIYDPSKAGLKSSVTIPLSNVESIEMVYENDSDVWQRMTGE